MSTNVHLTPALERFAKKCVKSGRYNNVSEVVRAGLRMLEEADERKRKFLEMIEDVENDVAENGTIPLDVALAEIDKIIDDAENSTGSAVSPRA
ncbi:MAG: type II toxin-antitoxin system ParD family antitoxin [Rhodospirillaceae bacterium]|nr:type II toxin-antitoxin system ParD family antitoxin [Rhodospirillaceae bacterium]